MDDCGVGKKKKEEWQGYKVEGSGKFAPLFAGIFLGY